MMGLTAVLPAGAATLHVSPGGSDSASGSIEAPWRSIQKALAAAQPGDVVALAPGVYLQDVRTVRDGRPSQPITITGPENAVISGAGAPRVFEVNHDFVELRGFTLDGRHAAEERKESYRDKLLYVIGATPGDGVEGLRVVGVHFRNAGGECLRLRYQAVRNEVAYSTFERCGVHDFRFKDGGKNGEGVYIGTSPKQLGKWGAPDAAEDRSSGNWIHHNYFNTDGNECVDIKEGSSGNVIEHNHCTGQRDKNAGGLGSRGSGNIFRYNVVTGSRGAGIRVGGWGKDEGINNDIYGNTFVSNGVGAVRAQRSPQGLVCENLSLDDRGGAATGRFRKEIDPVAACGAPRVAARDEPRSKEAGVRAAKTPKNAPPLICANADSQCAVARIKGDERNRIKILDASVPALRGKDLMVEEAWDRNAQALDLKRLKGETVNLEFRSLDRKVLHDVRVTDMPGDRDGSVQN